MTILNGVNAILCLVMGYVAFAIMAHRRPPKTTNDKVLQLGLGIVFGLAAMAAIMPFLTHKHPAIWTVGLRFGGFLVAVVTYDETFGIRKHWANVQRWFQGLIDRWGLRR